MLQTPFYDPALSYEDNYEKGPFGAFKKPNPPAGGLNKGQPKYDFLGQKIYLPFGIPAGPLLNSRFIKAAFEMGFDICVYKTVRSDTYPCHPFPNLLSVKVDGDLTVAKKPLVADRHFGPPLSITNSFGVPSKAASVWQEDVKKAISYAGKGQVLILSFMGTVREGQTRQEFIDDHKLAAKYALETGAKILEVNLSCPNIGNEGLICYDLKMSEEVLAAIRKTIGKKPLIVKIGYFADEKELEKFARMADKYAQDIAAINTIQAKIVDKNGNQALPGAGRLLSGVCGVGIKKAGLSMVARLAAIRKKAKLSYTITGVGGVTEVKDYFEYRAAGADVVMSATGAMWNPQLAREIKALDS